MKTTEQSVFKLAELLNNIFNQAVNSSYIEWDMTMNCPCMSMYSGDDGRREITLMIKYISRKTKVEQRTVPEPIQLARKNAVQNDEGVI